MIKVNGAALVSCYTHPNGRLLQQAQKRAYYELEYCCYTHPNGRLLQQGDVFTILPGIYVVIPTPTAGFYNGLRHQVASDIVGVVIPTPTAGFYNILNAQMNKECKVVIPTPTAGFYNTATKSAWWREKVVIPTPTAGFYNRKASVYRTCVDWVVIPTPTAGFYNFFVLY